jgi:hypothetical protein
VAKLNIEGLLHLLTDLCQAFNVATADLGCRPASEMDIVESSADLLPGEVIIGASNIDEFILSPAEAFDVELHAAVTERTDPLARLGILPVVADIVVHADPGAAEAVDEFDEPLRILVRWSIVIVHHLIPDVFNQYHLPHCSRHRQKLSDFLPGPLHYHVSRAVAAASDNNQYPTASSRM